LAALLQGESFAGIDDRSTGCVGSDMVHLRDESDGPFQDDPFGFRGVF